jgi:hypothetical protein
MSKAKSSSTRSPLRPSGDYPPPIPVLPAIPELRLKLTHPGSAVVSGADRGVDPPVLVLPELAHFWGRGGTPSRQGHRTPWRRQPACRPCPNGHCEPGEFRRGTMALGRIQPEHAGLRRMSARMPGDCQYMRVLIYASGQQAFLERD